MSFSLVLIPRRPRPRPSFSFPAATAASVTLTVPVSISAPTSSLSVSFSFPTARSFSAFHWTFCSLRRDNHVLTPALESTCCKQVFVMPLVTKTKYQNSIMSNIIANADFLASEQNKSASRSLMLLLQYEA